MIQTVLAGEDLHTMGAVEARRVKQWLDATARFRITHDIYATAPDGGPMTQLRVEQLDGGIERFDLFGQVVDERGRSTNDLYVECKNYSQAGNQPALFTEYLAVCYSAFAARQRGLHAVPSMEFMWATTHPFAQGRYRRLAYPDDGLPDEIASACAHPDHAARLGGAEFDSDLAAILATRMWFCIVNPRVTEMIMSRDMLAAVRSHALRGDG